ncbi:uncharacterized protein VTP21DRAFT_9878 [Calcarisporiella thermophila]|uniref:uncharacterized protein n=1 Tax=Calcarisporiella thermophila TaxID=911321 RepID=UPI0037449360
MPYPRHVNQRAVRALWFRIFCYGLFVFVLYFALRSIVPASIRSSSRSSPKTPPHAPHAAFIPPQPTQQAASRPLGQGNEWSQKARAVNARAQEEERKAVEKAQAEAERLLSPLRIEGIIGTSIRSNEEALRVRKIIDCMTRGSWVFDDTPRTLRKHLQDPIFGTCEKRFKKLDATQSQNKWNVPEFLKYIWKPADTCPLQPVDREEWCKMMKGRDVLLVGDELQYQIHDLLLDAFRDGPTVCYGLLSCKGHTICPSEGTRVRYIRNDVLSHVKVNPSLEGGQPSVDIIQQPWIRPGVTKAYRIMILNRGAHYQDDDAFRVGLAETLRELREFHPDLLIIYRNTPIGHIGCNNATAPLARPPSAADLEDAPYHLADFARQNAIARVLVERAGGIYVDVAGMTGMRPDGHVGGRDCWRYCMPGPIDIWTTLFYNVMRLVSGEVAA